MNIKCNEIRLDSKLRRIVFQRLRATKAKPELLIVKFNDANYVKWISEQMLIAIDVFSEF